MTLRNRFLLIGLGLVIFLITTPLLILFAQGFKLDLKNKKIIKTGTVVVETEPTYAKVFINGKEQKDKTPSTFRFLLPKDYEIKIEKEGFKPWLKRLTVRSELVTWANLDRDFVSLFLNTPVLLKSFPLKHAFVSQDMQTLAFINEGEFFYLKLGSISPKSIKEIDELGEKLPSISWQDSIRLFDFFASIKKSIFLLEPVKNIKKIVISSNSIAALINNELFVNNTDNELVFWSDEVKSFALDDNSLWYIEKNDLKKVSLEDKKTEVMAKDLPDSKQGEIVRTPNFLFLKLDDSLYSLNEKLEKIYEPINFVYWDEAAEKLVLSNPNEILFFDPENRNTSLIYRSSSEIRNPLLNQYTGFMFFISDGKVNAIELDGRDRRNSYSLLDSGGGSFQISKDAKKLYLYNDKELKIFEIR